MNDDLRVLIIEDDKDYAALVLRFLEPKISRENMVVVTTLRDALNTDGKFNVILSDIMLSDSNGIELINILHKKWPYIPIVAMSGYVGDNMTKTIIAAGAQDFLLKDEINAIRKHLPRVLSRAIDRSEILSKMMYSAIEDLRATIERMNKF